MPYDFFNGDTSSDDGLPVDATLACELQDHLVAFARTGDPNGAESPLEFPVYGAKGEVLLLEEDGVSVGADDMKSTRCQWIQTAMAEGLI